MAVRVAHGLFKYDLQKTSTEDNRGRYIISNIIDSPIKAWLIVTLKLPDIDTKYNRTVPTEKIEENKS